VCVWIGPCCGADWRPLFGNYKVIAVIMGSLSCGKGRGDNPGHVSM